MRTSGEFAARSIDGSRAYYNVALWPGTGTYRSGLARRRGTIAVARSIRFEPHGGCESTGYDGDGALCCCCTGVFFSTPLLPACVLLVKEEAKALTLSNSYPKLSKTQRLNQHQGPFFFKKKNRGQAKSRWFTTKAIPKYAMSYMVWYMVTISQITNEICLYRASITWCRA